MGTSSRSPGITVEQIKYTRDALGLTQAEFAAFFGVEENTVWRWEHGIHAPVGARLRSLLYRYRRAKGFENKEDEVLDDVEVGGHQREGEAREGHPGEGAG